MSYLLKPMQLDFLNNKDRENVFISSHDPDESFNFKYVSRSQFKHIIKDVQRQRTRKKEESAWTTYVCRHDSDRTEYDDYGVPSISDVRRLIGDNTEEIDQELKRLKEDALPERLKRISKSLSADGTRDNEAEKLKKLKKVSGRTGGSTTGSRAAVSGVEDEIESPSSVERSPVSKLEYSTKRSLSERTLRAKSESSDEYTRLTKHSDYNWCTGQRRDYENDKDDEIYDVRLHPQVAHKILAIQRKISNLLDEIGFRLSRIPLPDGDRDLRRRHQCVMEFAIRFSRNYLYDLGRQIADIRRHLRAISPSARLKSSQRGFSLHVQAMEQKLTSAHQLLLQALNAYCKHIPSSVIKGHPGKLKEILQVVIDLRDICAKIHLTIDYFERGDVEPPPLGKDIQNRCGAILSKLRLSSDNESQVFNHNVQPISLEGLGNKSKNKNDNGKGLPARLSMYNANISLPRKNLVNKKHVPSKKRDKKLPSNFGTVPQRYHPTTPESQKNIREIPKQSRTKIRLPRKEDDISTMISILPTDSDAGSSIAICENSETSASIHKGSITRRFSSRNPSSNDTRASNTPTNGQRDENDNELTNGSNPITDKQLSTLVPVIADLMTLVRNQNDVSIRPVSSDSMQALINFLEKYRETTNIEIPAEKITNKPTSSSSTTKNYENTQNPIRRTIETRIGPKNMQLICLSPEEEKDQERTNKTVHSQDVANSALSNQRNGMLRVSESSLKAILKYRDDFQDWTRSNPMYTSKSRNKPWDVVAWIADKLIEELVVDVSKEFDIHETIQKLLELEFKEF